MNPHTAKIMGNSLTGSPLHPMYPATCLHVWLFALSKCSYDTYDTPQPCLMEPKVQEFFLSVKYQTTSFVRFFFLFSLCEYVELMTWPEGFLFSTKMNSGENLTFCK